MATQPYLQQWPFQAETEVVLRWVRSPRRITDEKQWCVTACFETHDGRGHEFDLPWGVLPLLRLGQYYANGFALAGEFVGREVLLNVRGEPQLVAIADAMPAEFLPSIRQFIGRDLCFLLSGENTVILPVIEVVRAFLAPNRSLAYGLFEPQFLEKIVAETYITGSRLHLAFTREISPQALSKPVVGHIARLLYDDSFRKAWDSIARQRFSILGAYGDAAVRPLTSLLPDLESTWKARVLVLGKIFLVLEVMHVTPVKTLPFTGVHFTHPRMTATPRKKSTRKQQPKHASPGAAGENTALNTRLKGARVPREARELKAPPSPIFNFRTTDIVRVPKLRDDSASGTTSGSVADDDGQTVKKPHAAVNMADDTADGGCLRVGEFRPVQVDEKGLLLRPLPFHCPSTSGLTFFAAMLNSLDQEGPDDLEVGWCLGAFTSSTDAGQISRFALVGDLARQYALVRLRWPQTTAWLLEFGKPDCRAPSTLVFRPLAGAKDGVLALVEKLVASVSPDGSWQTVKLSEMRVANELNCELARHSSRLPDVWARRLYHKAAQLAGGSPKFIVKA